MNNFFKIQENAGKGINLGRDRPSEAKLGDLQNGFFYSSPHTHHTVLHLSIPDSGFNSYYLCWLFVSHNILSGTWPLIKQVNLEHVCPSPLNVCLLIYELS